MSETLTPSMRIKKTLQFDSIDWARVSEVLESSFKLEKRLADRMVQKFISRVLHTLAIEWFEKEPLRSTDNRVVSSLCEIYGADVICIERKSWLLNRKVLPRFQQSLTLYPSLKKAREGAAGGRTSSKVLISWGPLKISASRASHSFLLHLCAGALGLIGYTLAYGMLLYGIVVLFIFLLDPGLITVVATEKASIGLALLCILIGIFGISGKALKNLWRLASTKEREFYEQQASRVEQLSEKKAVNQ